MGTEPVRTSASPCQETSQQMLYHSVVESVGARSQGYLPKVTNMTNKLSDGLEAYAEILSSQGLKRQYVLDQLEGTALDYTEGLYLQQEPRLSAEQMIVEVANFLTDPAERERAKDQFRVLRIQEEMLFKDFYREFCLLASLACKANADDLYDELATKVTPFYRRAGSMALLNSRSLAEDVYIYYHIDATEAGIKTVNAAYRSYTNSIPRSRQGATYSSSKKELAVQVRPIPVDKPAYAREHGSLLPNTPRHFTPDRNPYTQPVAVNRGTNPFRTSTDRARSQTPYAVNTVEYIEESDEGEAPPDAPEDQDLAVQAEVIAHTVYQEMDRAKGAA
ncbi:hypothetical protein CJF32_00008805 [Rutstroemia sp. NJR-2017a WRK4]|nr:hypothetical protein CJF32_00008805 [Rutstroemia sp. NJR-2017a WRK4]